MNRFLPFKKPHKLKTHTSSSVITLPFHEMLTDQHQQLEGLVEKHVSTMPRRPRLVGAEGWLVPMITSYPHFIF